MRGYYTMEGLHVALIVVMIILACYWYSRREGVEVAPIRVYEGPATVSMHGQPAPVKMYDNRAEGQPKGVTKMYHNTGPPQPSLAALQSRGYMVRKSGWGGSGSTEVKMIVIPWTSLIDSKFQGPDRAGAGAAWVNVDTVKPL